MDISAYFLSLALFRFLSDLRKDAQANSPRFSDSSTPHLLS
jgi:hypothetical protein